MNRFTAWTTAVSAAVVLAVGVTGCGVSMSDSAPPRQAETRTAPCNLGAEWDADASVTHATYIEPSLTEELRQRYVGMIANDSCGDAEVLNWQDLRRALGESDGICRIAWYEDPVTDSTYDIGCVVPVEVIPGAVL